LEKDDASYETMMTVIGQGETLVSPYHMVLIAAAIGNGGILMEPYLVDQIVSYTGTSVQKNMPQK
jgi:peptidoglycan glycosyltransferase